MENNNDKKEQSKYSDSRGTGVFSTMLFMIIILVVMYILSKYLGN